jgi:hypothetical protein
MFAQFPLISFKSVLWSKSLLQKIRDQSICGQNIYYFPGLEKYVFSWASFILLLVDVIRTGTA